MQNNKAIKNLNSGKKQTAQPSHPGSSFICYGTLGTLSNCPNLCFSIYKWEQYLTKGCCTVTVQHLHTYINYIIIYYITYINFINTYINEWLTIHFFHRITSFYSSIVSWSYYISLIFIFYGKIRNLQLRQLVSNNLWFIILKFHVWVGFIVREQNPF